MRLLEIEAGGDDEVSLREFVDRKDVPPYAILSHTWLADHDEVLFKDMEDADRGKAKSKAGYNKIRFCAKQAAIDGLRYLWIDTCCIDKFSSAELSEAINSMFRWYKNAAKCYVYLTDVSINDPLETTGGNQQPVQKTAFQRSRWFTRGWTLQELLAPKTVDFFTLEGERLGNKESLMRDIHKATGIPNAALQGQPLNRFTIEQRMSWAAKRETKREEDAAYSLLGIFEVPLSLIYGEGRKHAFNRLRREIALLAADELSDGMDVQQYYSPSEPISRTDPGISKDESLVKRQSSPTISDESAVETPEVKSDPFKSKIIHADIRVDEIKDNNDGVHHWPASAIDQFSAYDQYRPEVAHMWWNESIARNMSSYEGYAKIAVLLIKWSEELDELKTHNEVCGLPSARFNYPVHAFPASKEKPFYSTLPSLHKNRR
jgi:hypothetical protein